MQTTVYLNELFGCAGRTAVVTGASSGLGAAMARTLAQQLRVPLVGVSSFALMAARLCGRLSDPSDRFWITRELPRRGVVGGAYQLNDGAVEELEPPHLLQPGRSLGPMVLEAHDDVEADATQLRVGDDDVVGILITVSEIA